MLSWLSHPKRFHANQTAAQTSTNFKSNMLFVWKLENCIALRDVAEDTVYAAAKIDGD